MNKQNGGVQRIPSTLQAVFLSSNRGGTVNKPPPERMASRVFFRRFIGRSKSSNKGADKVAEKPKKGTSQQSRKLMPTRTSSYQEEKSRKKPTRPIPTLSPQQYVEAMIKSRGYSVTSHKTLACAFHNHPTPLQEASYGACVVDLVKKGNVKGLKEALSCGISPNPCNNFGESLLHMACRKGDSNMLKVMLEAGADVQVADDYGRTPMHDACWAAKPAFDVVDQLLQIDASLLFMKDCRASLPLDYVRKDHWADWLQYLVSRKDIYWPHRDKTTGFKATPPLILEPPYSRPARDPENALTLALARLVASGRMKPSEAVMLNSDDTLDDSDGEPSDSCSDDDYDDSSSQDEEEMEEMIARLTIVSRSVSAEF